MHAIYYDQYAACSKIYQFAETLLFLCLFVFYLCIVHAAACKGGSASGVYVCVWTVVLFLFRHTLGIVHHKFALAIFIHKNSYVNVDVNPIYVY